MRLHQIRRPKGAVKERKRVGRGPGSGLGKTAGRGQKGQKARNTVRRGFEGGQMPLQRRLPKVGFRNPFRKEYAYVNVRDLNRFEDGTEVTPALLLETGLIKKIKDGVKILGKGELEKRLVVVAHKVSRGARQKIEAAGGQVKEA